MNMILPSGGVPSFCALEDVALEQAMYQAYHRYLADYCAPYPDRLTSLLLVSAARRRGVGRRDRAAGRDAAWPVGIFPICPPELSLDDPAWEPIWAAAQDHDLTVVIHSFTMTVPYPPGTWDTWDNVFLQRAAGHMWNAQRNMAAIIGAGVLDRYPALRLTSLECGHGWLAFWAARLDELAEMSRHALPRAQAAAERVHPRAAVLPEHPAPRGRAVAAAGDRGARRRDPDVRHRLSALGELVSEVGGRGARLDVDSRKRRGGSSCGRTPPAATGGSVRDSAARPGFSFGRRCRARWAPAGARARRAAR